MNTISILYLIPGPSLRIYCVNISKNFLSFDTANLGTKKMRSNLLERIR